MIIAARVAKPEIPQQLQGDFVRVEEEISKLKVRGSVLADHGATQADSWRVGGGDLP